MNHPQNFWDQNYGEWQVTFNIGEEIRYTNDGQDEKAQIMTSNFYNEGMRYIIRFESGE